MYNNLYKTNEMSEDMKRKIFIICTIAIMVLIFYFSMENSSESSGRSGGVTEFILKLIVPDYEKMSFKEKKNFLCHSEYIIRKLAHFSIYTMLGFLASLAVGKRKLLSTGTLFTLGFGFLYACSDELHQYFVPGRSCQFKDVIIDTFGVITGIIISIIIIRIYDVLKNKFSHSPS